MSATLVCITNDMHDVRSCTITGEHQTGCDTYEYQWGDDVQQYVATGRDCRGCLPQAATNGHLCAGCWISLQSADQAYPALAEVLEKYDHLVTPDTEGSRGSNVPAIPLPATRIALDEIESYRRNKLTDTMAWAKRAADAPDAVRFSHAVRRALRSFPTQEDPHRILRARCPSCELLALMWTPPVLAGDAVRIECRNPACGLIVTHDDIDPITRPESEAA
jgi:hypothetical protein